MTTNAEYYQAWNNWYHFWETELGEDFDGHADRIGGYNAFERFIGHKDPFATDYRPVPPEAAHRVRLLLSPHHYAILKAYMAKQEVP